MRGGRSGRKRAAGARLREREAGGRADGGEGEAQEHETRDSAAEPCFALRAVCRAPPRRARLIYYDGGEGTVGRRSHVTLPAHAEDDQA